MDDILYKRALIVGWVGLAFLLALLYVCTVHL